jgi:D-alanyl-D-alanine carboxypeptidase/D-alanyl-D-alanine-endopeptidase (penicillin-binding protein 4)
MADKCVLVLIKFKTIINSKALINQGNKTFKALKTLKPNYNWKTEAWVRGKIKNGVLDGDLILKGYGDPHVSNIRSIMQIA